MLIVAFFVGGQELNKIIRKKHLEIEDLVIPSQDEVILGTKRTQLFFIVRAFFILLAIQGAYALIMRQTGDGAIAKAYPILTYLGLMGAMIIIDSRATIRNKPLYLHQGTRRDGGASWGC